MKKLNYIFLSFIPILFVLLLVSCNVSQNSHLNKTNQIGKINIKEYYRFNNVTLPNQVAMGKDFHCPSIVTIYISSSTNWPLKASISPLNASISLGGYGDSKNLTHNGDSYSEGVVIIDYMEAMIQNISGHPATISGWFRCY